MAFKGLLENENLRDNIPIRFTTDLESKTVNVYKISSRRGQVLKVTSIHAYANYPQPWQIRTDQTTTDQNISFCT